MLSKNIKGQSTIDSIINAKGYFFTDIINKPKIFNRSSLIYKPKDFDFDIYKIEKVYEYPSLYENQIIHKISN